jgi:hypothetical protein
VIAEHVPGSTARDQLADERMRPVEAALSFARLAAALETLHVAGCVHGAVGCSSIVVTPTVGVQRPMMTQLITVPTAAYCSPERASNKLPSPSDDVWALHVALYMVLTRRAPFAGTTLEQVRASQQTEAPGIDKFGVHDLTLQGILEKGLVIDPRSRRSDAAGLERALTLWAHQRGSMPDALERLDGDRHAEIPDPPLPLVHRSRGPAPSRAPKQLTSLARGESESDAELSEDDIDTRVMTGRELLEPAAARSSAHRSVSTRRQDPPRRSPGNGPHPATAPPLAKPAAPEHPAAARVSSVPPPAARGCEDAAPSDPGPPGAAPRGASAQDAPRKRRSGVGTLVVALLIVLVAGGAAAGFLAPSRAKALGAAAYRAVPPELQRYADMLTAGPQSAPALPPPGAVAPPQPDHSPALPQDTSTQPAAPLASGSTAFPSAPGSSSPGTSRDLHACMASFFESGTFVPGLQSDFRFLCADTDLREVSSRVLRAIVSHGRGKITPGMRTWSTFGWYELAATAVMRGTCCPPDIASIRLPKARPPCNDEMNLALQQLAATRPSTQRARELTDAFTASINCSYEHAVPRPFYYRKRPNTYEADQFVQFVERAAANTR